MSMEAPTAAVSPAARPAPRKPRWLTFFAVVAIAIGVMRTWEMVSLVVVPRVLDVEQRWLDDLTPDSSAAGVAIKQSQHENFRRMREVFDRYARTIAVLAVGDVLMALALIAGGIGVLSLRPRARQLVIAGFFLALILSVGTGGQVIQLQRDLIETTHNGMQRSLEAAGRTPSPGLRTIESVGGMFGSLRLIVEQILLGVAVGLSAGGIIYFTRPKVRQLFAGQAPS
jgi:hypothetical protein